MERVSIMDERSSSGYHRLKPTYLNRPELELRTVNSIEDEYWNLLLYYANIYSEGAKLLSTSDGRIRRAAHSAFSAFILQAKAYYDSAKSLHHRASSLNYYYCFLNLAKAAVIVKNPRLHSSEFVHGLSGSGSNHPNLFDRTSQVFVGRTRDGKYNMYDQLYQAHYGTVLPNKSRLKIGTLLRYCSEATHQYHLAVGKMQPRILQTYYAIRVDTTVTPYKYWPLLGIQGAHLLDEFPTFKRALESNFERVKVHNEQARLLFGLLALESSLTTYFQGKEVFLEGRGEYFVSRSKRYLDDTIGKNMQSVYYDDSHDFLVTLPLRVNLKRPMNEFLAIYIIIHHLSELVRYRPQYLEKMLKSKEAWALESIIDTAPAMFLRGITPLITGQDYRVLKR